MLAMVSCEKKDAVKEGQGELVSTTFVCTATPTEKTAVASEDGETATIVWSNGDDIKVFNATGGYVCPMTKGSGTSEAVFEGQCEGTGPWTAICPSSAANAYNNGAITIALPASQDYAYKTFAQGAMPCVAYSTSNQLMFNHVCGALKLSLKGEGTIGYIKITDRGAGKLNGEFIVTPEESAVAVKSGEDGTNAIQLNCGTDGVALSTTNATDFWFVIPAGAFSSGFEAVVVTTDGKLAKLGTHNAQTISAGVVKPMQELTIEFNKTAQEWEFKNTQGWEMVQVL